MHWCMYDAAANRQNIPADSFVFWGTMYQAKVYSNQTQTQVLWCANSATCFGASLMDTDTWTDTYGSTISGQWRVAPIVTGTVTNLRIQLIKPMNQEFFPEIRGPAWLKNTI